MNLSPNFCFRKVLSIDLRKHISCHQISMLYLLLSITFCSNAQKRRYESLLIPYNYNPNLVNGKHVISALRPGIYLKKISSDDDKIPKFVVLHWSEDGCYEVSASYYLKKNMTNLHRLAFVHFFFFVELNRLQRS